MLLGNINQSFSGKGTGQLRSMFLFHKPCWFQTLTFRNLWPYFYIMLPVFGCGNGMLVALVWSSSCVCIFLGLLLLAGSSSCVLSGALLHARMQITEEEREKNRCLASNVSTETSGFLCSVSFHGGDYFFHNLVQICRTWFSENVLPQEGLCRLSQCLTFYSLRE